MFSYLVFLRFLPHFLFLAYAFPLLVTVNVQWLVLLLYTMGIMVHKSGGRPPVLAEVFVGFLSRFRKLGCVRFLAHDLQFII